jgi:E3 SUMO-protein ligase PIAS1
MNGNWRLTDSSSQKPRHSIRLFCTSAEHYRPQYSYGQPPTTRSIPIEYPSQPEVLYDDAPVIFKDKGLRGRAGTAPPLDVATSRKGINLLPGRLTTVQFAHMGPTLKKQSGPAKVSHVPLQCTKLTLTLAILLPDRLDRNHDEG